MSTTTLYGIADSAFHGGGILYRTTSPREALRAMPRFRDGCFDGLGCQGFVASPDGGETWYPLILEAVAVGDAMADYHYADMGVRTEGWHLIRAVSKPLRPAHETQSAQSLALA